MLMNTNDLPARLLYQANGFRLLSPGTYVVCAVSGASVPLESLRYWSVPRQEAYASAELATRRLMGLT